jgi:hypothetical protein
MRVMEKVKTIKFNLDKVEDKEIFKFASAKGNFQAYMKSLVYDDMRTPSKAVYTSSYDGVIRISVSGGKCHE